MKISKEIKLSVLMFSIILCFSNSLLAQSLFANKDITIREINDHNRLSSFYMKNGELNNRPCDILISDQAKKLFSKKRKQSTIAVPPGEIAVKYFEKSITASTSIFGEVSYYVLWEAHLNENPYLKGIHCRKLIQNPSSEEDKSWSNEDLEYALSNLIEVSDEE